MEIIIITLLLLLNGIFAMFEIALVSSRKSRLEEMAKFGNKRANTVLLLLQEPEKILSAIQAGITLVGIISGAYGGIAIAEDLVPVFQTIPVLASYAEILSLILVVGVITYFSLIIGELVPKTLALNHPEPIAIYLSPFMTIIGKITYPVVWLLSVSTKLVLKVFNIKSKDNPPVTEEELIILLKQSSDHGVIEKEESEIISEVIRFGDKRARSITNPRLNVEWLDINDPDEKIIKMAMETTFSRLVVCRGSVDKILGVITIKDLLTSYISNKSLNIQDLIIEPLYIPEQMHAFKVLEIFRDSKNHFGIVVNEYGGMEGIITLHDLIENIVGELPAFDDIEAPEVVKRDDGTYLVDGSMKIDDFINHFNLFPYFNQVRYPDDIETVGGFAMHKLKKVPREGDFFNILNYKCEIIDMDDNRVDKLLLTRIN
jgi:putative hemolysin